MPRHRAPDVDSAILNILSKRQTAGYNELYQLFEKMHRHISYDAFDRHFRNLRKSGNIERKDTGAKGGRKGQYCISDKGRQALRLFGSLEGDRQKLILRRERAFQLLFFFEANKDIEFEQEMYGTEDDLIKLVSSKYRVPFTKKDLVIDYQFRKEVDCTVTVYLPISSCILIVKEEFNRDNNKTDETTTAVMPYRQDKGEKISDNHHNGLQGQQQPVQGKNDGSNYAFFLVKTLGITISQILHDKKFPFQHLGFTSSELEQAFNTLRDETLIKVKGVLGNDIYYTTAENELYHLMRDCWIIHNQIMRKMTLVWMYFRRPTWQERKWLKMFYGPERTSSTIKDDNKFRRQIRHKQRLELGQMQKEQREKGQKPTTSNNDALQQQTSTAIDKTTTTTIISVKDEIAIYDRLSKAEVKRLKEKHTVTIRKYSFPYEAIMNDLVYPPFLREIVSTISASAELMIATRSQLTLHSSS
jgi:DNA-binding PadR family transcriptional regulator